MTAPACPFKTYPMRPGLEEPPATMVGLPNDRRGYPIPYFVDYVGDEPEFRAFDPVKMRDCINKRLCWTCGKPLWREAVFVIGPMCAINRVNSEPPNHRECARYSARNCPFLSRPHMVRRTDGLPEEGIKTAGISIPRNPGAMCLWYTYRYKPFRTQADSRGVGAGILFELGNPFRVEWYAEGREATRAEILASVDTGLPLLYAANDKEYTEQLREEGRIMIQQRLDQLMRLVPKR